MKTISKFLFTMTIFVLSASVTLGKPSVVLDSVSDVEIKQSINTLSDVATLIIPRHTEELQGKILKDYINVGDSIEIQLGYNGENYPEFKGYVTNVGASVPVVISCEDEMYMLRSMRLSGKQYESTSLKSILNENIKGYDLVIDYDFTFGKLTVQKGVSAYDLLMHLKKEYGIDSYFKDKSLHTGWQSDVATKYKNNPNFRKTTINVDEYPELNNGLKYVSIEGRKCRIKATSHLPNGTKYHEELGDADGPLRSLSFYNIPKDQLKDVAAKELNKMKFSGYEGSITRLGWPRVSAGESVELVSDDNPDKNGSYLVAGLTKRFNEGGYRRIMELGLKI